MRVRKSQRKARMITHVTWVAGGAALLTSAVLSGPSGEMARVAAVCLYNGVRELWTADRDFSRFQELSTRNPVLWDCRR